jgi:DNA-directed RNA polymerase specialized sigma24 family protein
MSADGSVTHWLNLLQAGDRAAARPLWERYFPLLVARARATLRGRSPMAADEEDVALSAFDSFCRGAEGGRFPRLHDRDDLWRLLLLFTARKAAHLVRDERRDKRGGGKMRAEADLADDSAESDEGFLARVLGPEPTPEFAAEMAEECRLLLDKLGTEELRSIAVWTMEGDTVEEVAARLGRSVRTVARKLAVIRDLWREEGQPS